MTASDAGQSGWDKTETKLTGDDAAADFKFLWKLKLGQASKDSQSFSEPLLRQRLINANGFKDLVYWGSSDTLYAVDNELGTVEWQKHFESAPSRGAAACISSHLGIVMEPPPVINFNARRVPGQAPPPQPPPLSPSERRLGVKAGGGGFGLQGIYVLTSDGYLHEQVLATGHDYAPPVKFLPGAGGNAYGLNIYGQTVFAVTGHDCASVPNGAFALEMTPPDYPVSSYTTQKVRSLNLTGLPVAPDGTAFLITGGGSSGSSSEVQTDSVVALTVQGMKVKDWYTPAAGAYNKIEYVTPITFPYKGRQLVVAPGANGSFVLLDAASLGGPDHHTALSSTAGFSKPGEKHIWDGFAEWQDKDGTTWVIASISGAVDAKEGSANGQTPHGAMVAFKVQDKDGQPALTPVWISRDLVNPAPPVITSNVVIALSGGNAQTHAVLYVLDAATGKELTSSKDEIPTYTHFSGVSFGDSHAYFTDHENTLYAFGIGMEH